MKTSEKTQPFRMVFMKNFIFILVIQISGCSRQQEPSPFGDFFPIPPGILTIQGEDPYGPPAVPPAADIFWSNTISEQGYAQNRNYQLYPPAEFVEFYRAVTRLSVGANYRPRYWILRPNTRGFLSWMQVENLSPENRDFWITRGTFENQEIGPLTMIYNGDLLDRQNLTIVVTDLEEQGLNMSLLADLIRNKLLTTDDYAAEVIALKLQFNGLNYKPDPYSINNMVESRYSGYKPIYAIVSGPKEAVSLFSKRFYEQTTQFNIDYKVVTTTQRGTIAPLAITDVIIPQSAIRSEFSRVVQNNKRLMEEHKARNPKMDLWNIRSGRDNYSGLDRIWNLQDRSDAMVNHFALVVDDELKRINEKLVVFIFQYKTETPREGKDGDWLWQLNISFNMPHGCDISELSAQIRNYRYLVPAPSEEEVNPFPVWQQNDALITRDFSIGQPVLMPDLNTVNVYAAPKDMERGNMESAVVCFDLIVRVRKQIVIPEWVNDFDDTTGNTQDKTLNFRNFINNLLKGNSATGIEFSDDEFIRIPIVLFDMPFNQNTARRR